MQHRTPACQLPAPRVGDSPRKSPTLGGIPCQKNGTQSPLALVHGDAQEVANTASRRTGPRRWLRAVQWLIASGIHPKANATTLRIAEDLAADMDYDTGHVLYRLERRGAPSTVKRHVGYLRELGALVWVVHGTRTNIRRALGLKGYAGTATVYAAAIPPAFDHAMGHCIVGTGYEARIVVDQRGQTPAPVDNSPVDNTGSEPCGPPSLTWVKEEGKLKVEGGSNYTSRKRASRSTAPIPHQTTNSSSEDGTRRRTPAQVASEIRETQLVRALVNWTQAERRTRRLAYVLRPFFDRGLRAHDIAAELAGMTLGWRPKHPAAFIRAALAEQATHDARLTADDARRTDATWREQAAQAAADRASLEALFASAGPERTDDDRRAARLDWNNWPEVAEHYADDPDDAIDLYGERLCAYALRQDARTNPHREVTHV